MRAAAVAAILLLALCAADAAPAPSAAMPEPIAWRQNVFSIPYRIRNQPDAEAAVAEVQLFVSDDAGRTWRLTPRSMSSATSIIFTAAHDGEHWFALRTIDRTGRVAPTGPHRPGLRVIVDTQQPKLSLQAAASPAGAIDVRWHAEDTNLALDSLKIETRSGPNSQWQPLAIGRPPVDLRGARSGSATWWPPSETGRVTIRAEVLDQAGNRTVAQREVTLHRPARTGVAAAAVSNAVRRIPTPLVAPGIALSQSIPVRTTTGQNWPANQVSLTPLGRAPSGTASPAGVTDPVWRPGADVAAPRPR